MRGYGDGRQKDPLAVCEDRKPLTPEEILNLIKSNLKKISGD
jgi:hypothetical protein